MNTESNQLKKYLNIDKKIKNTIKEIRPPEGEIDVYYKDSLLEGLYKLENYFLILSDLTEIIDFNDNMMSILKKCRIEVLKANDDKKIKDVYMNKISNKNIELREFINEQISNNTSDYEEAFTKVFSVSDLLTFYHFCILNKISKYFIDKIEERGMKNNYEYRKY